MSAVEEAGAYGWILLSWRRWDSKTRMRNRLFAYRIGDWIRIEKEAEEEGYKSVAWSKLIQRSLEIERKKGKWLLEKLFQNNLE